MARCVNCTSALSEKLVPIIELSPDALDLHMEWSENENTNPLQNDAICYECHNLLIKSIKENNRERKKASNFIGCGSNFAGEGEKTIKLEKDDYHVENVSEQHDLVTKHAKDSSCKLSLRRANLTTKNLLQRGLY